MKRVVVSFVTFIFMVFAVGMSAAFAQAALGPIVPKAVGAPHPEGNEFWRINHMDLLQHDRDETMHLGNREIDASLKECVACHAVDDAQGEPVGFDSEKHICRTCHDFAAVKIDCFSCHQSKPDADILTQLLNEAPTNVSMFDVSGGMQNYLTSLHGQISGNSLAGEVSQ